jgi:hypothetical protein
MSNRFLISAAAITLIASAGFANAQGTGMGREQGGASAQQSAPSTGNSAAPSNRNATEPSGSSSGMKSTQSDEKSPAGAAKGKSAEETAPGQKSKSMSSENETKSGKDVKSGKDMKAEGREDRKDNMKAEGKEGRDRDQNAQIREGRDKDQNAQTRDRNDNMNAQTKSQTTTGQAGAGAKLSTEQRTKITTVIRNERVAPVDNVNFSIAVGTRVPREGVSFRPLPVEVVTIYPEWRGYEFIRVRDQILVIDPATYEIVAILDV